jgi:hypothetical protein
MGKVNSFCNLSLVGQLDGAEIVLILFACPKTGKVYQKEEFFPLE